MNSSNYRLRRATLEDISLLSELWKSMQFPAEDLSKRITEFQVAESAEGKLIGAVGLQIVQRQGRIHSEAFVDFSLADQLRPLFWERVNAVATNHGLLRLWTRENAPFWAHCGLKKADPEELAKLPDVWRAEPGEWLTIKLKEDLDKLVSADKEFALFMESEKQKTQKAFQQAKMLKVVATLLAIGLLLVVIAGTFLLVRRNPHLLGR